VRHTLTAMPTTLWPDFSVTTSIPSACTSAIQVPLARRILVTPQPSCQEGTSSPFGRRRDGTESRGPLRSRGTVSTTGRLTDGFLHHAML
jgi:hypothetical protein